VKKTILGLMLTLLLIGISMLEFDIQPVVASEIVYIRANGSVEGTDKIQRVGDIYTFTGNINDSIVVERDNIVLDGAGYTLQGTGRFDSRGIDLSGRSNVTIENMQIKSFAYVIRLYYSSNNIIVGNNIKNNWGGIELYSSSNNAIAGNNIKNNEWDGIYLTYSYYNIISGNNITENLAGIYLKCSSKNGIVGNNITENNDNGILFNCSSNNTLRSNSIADNRHSFAVEGEEFSHFVNDVDASNTVNGKPIYYWVNKQDLTIPLDAGQVVLVNCTSITVQNLNLTNNWQGVFLAYSNNASIRQNNIRNNKYGIYLYGSSNNNIVEDNITNNEYGVCLCSSSNNKFYHNNLVDNTQQIHFERLGYANFWDDGYPSGGNYWSDYTGMDIYSGSYQNETGSDGIGDTPYIIDTNNQDRYPLTKPKSPSLPIISLFATIILVITMTTAAVIAFRKKHP